MHSEKNVHSEEKITIKIKGNTFISTVQSGELSDQSPNHSVFPQGFRKRHNLTPFTSTHARRL